jgi:hypothetical protein
MQAHVIAIVAMPTGEALFQWRCSCEASGPWRERARQARNGGARHVAKMERGR